MKLLNPPTAIIPGSKMATTTPSALAAATVVREVLLRAPAANAVDVMVGNADFQGFPLPPGAVLVVSIDDLSKVWVVTASGSATVNYIAEA